jgi:hypothetical protein
MVTIDAQVSTECEIVAIDRVLFKNVSEELCQRDERMTSQVDRRTGHGARLSCASSSDRAATAERA